MDTTTVSGAGRSKDYSALYLPLSIILAGVLVAGGLYLGLSRTNGTTGQQPAARVVDVKKVKTDGEPFIGKADAPLTMAFWSDYQCPFCRAVEVGGIPQIPTKPAIPEVIKQYVDTGKLKIVFKDFAFLGNDSITAAEYEHAMWKLYPAKYYEWRMAMFEAQDEEGDEGFGDEASIVKLTGKIAGVDAAKVKADVAAHKAEYDAAIQADTAEGQSFGVNGTPGFIVGTKSLDGAQEFPAFKAAIESQLK